MKDVFERTLRLDTSALEGVVPARDIRALTALFYASARKTEPFIHPRFVSTVIEPEWVPPEWGMSAYAHTYHMHISIDPRLPRWRKEDAEGRARFSAVVAHELHHCMRRRKWLRGNTLGDRLVTEGLAVQFETETGHPDYNKGLSGVAVRTLRRKAVPLLGTKFRDFPFPRGGEYDLGQALMADFLRDRNLTASAALRVAAKDVMKWWEKKEFALSGERPYRQPAKAMRRAGL